MKMNLKRMGINYTHDSSFNMVRENGSGDNLLLIFKTPAYIMLDGIKTNVTPNSAILFPKGMPQIYGAADEIYINHWVHFENGENDIFFDNIAAVFNRPVTVSSMSYVEKALEMLSEESVSSPANEECISLLIQLLIAKSVGGETRKPSPHGEGLRKVRAEIYANPAGRFSVNDFAKMLALSSAYFQTLYKNEFGVSCYEDVLKAKTELAEYYLKSTDASVHDISELCGYDNDVHFMRQFKKRVGMTTLQYRIIARRSAQDNGYK